jgi:transcriptional regulator with XRE-family HTH domain
MADLTGMSVSAYWRREQNKSKHDINLRELVNCALVLGVEVTELFEDEWLRWYVFDSRRPQHGSRAPQRTGYFVPAVRVAGARRIGCRRSQWK